MKAPPNGLFSLPLILLLAAAPTTVFYFLKQETASLFLKFVYMNDKKNPVKKTRAELEQKKKLAYTLYVENGFDQKVIAVITGISTVSISKWKNSDKLRGKDWESDRAEKRSGFDNERRRFKLMINRILDQAEQRPYPDNITNSKEGDAIAKLSKSAKNLINELTFDHRSKSYEMLAHYVQETYGPEDAVKLIEWAHEFQMSKV